MNAKSGHHGCELRCRRTLPGLARIRGTAGTAAVKAFEVDYGDKYPNSLADHQPESTFATVWLRTKVTKGPGSRASLVKPPTITTTERNTAMALDQSDLLEALDTLLQAPAR